MNDYGLTVENILASLPCVLANDETITALAEGVARLLARQVREIEDISIYPRLDEASEALCDILARDFDVGWYSYDYPLEIKREQIKSTFRMHRKLGTAASVKELVRSVFGQGEVVEWFDYGGEPYHFRIQTDTALSAETYNYIYNMIRLVKSVRSRLDSVQIMRNTEAVMYGGTAQYMVYYPPAVMDGYSVARTTESCIFAGNSFGTIHHAPAIFETEGGRTYAAANE